MQLTSYTDYALRTLIAVGIVAPERLTVGEISGAYGISTHHLLKVVQGLSALGYVETSRGKAGGVRLALDAGQIRLGQVVRQLESELGVVACLRKGDDPCVIAPACRLKGVLSVATERFLATLDEFSLADVLVPRTRLAGLLDLRTSRDAP